MSVNGITLTGWKEFEQKALDMSKLLEDEMDEAAELAARTWAQGAARDAPKDFGKLSGHISPSKGEFVGQWEVNSPMQYSPFMEWGTKLRAFVPGELSDYASQFQHVDFSVPTEGGLKEIIYAWAQRKGIPKAAWWPIYITIRRIGVTPHPFFFTQRPIVEKQLLGDLEQMINTPR